MLGQAESTRCGASHHRSKPSCSLCNRNCPPSNWSLWSSTSSLTSTSQDMDAQLQRSHKHPGYREWERVMSLTRMSWFQKKYDKGGFAAAAAAAEFQTEETLYQSEKDDPDDKAQLEQLEQILSNVCFEDDGKEEESAMQGGKDGSGTKAARPGPKTQHQEVTPQARGSIDWANLRDDRGNFKVEQSYNLGPDKWQMKRENKYSIKKDDNKYSEFMSLAGFQQMKEQDKYSKKDEDDKYNGAMVGDQQWNTHTQESTANKHSFTPEQMKELQCIFEKTPYPCLVMRSDLARIMNVTEGRIKMWFRHRRSKLRRLGITPYSRNQSNPMTGILGRNCGVSQQRDQTQMTSSQGPMLNQVPVAPVPNQGPMPNQVSMAPVPSKDPMPNQVPVAPVPSQGPMPNQAPMDPVPSKDPMLNQVPVAPVPSQGPMPNQAPMAPVPSKDPMPNQVPVAPVPSQGLMPNQAPMDPVPSKDPMPNQVPVAPMPSEDPKPNQAPMALMPSQEPRPNEVPVVPMPNQVPVVPVLCPVPMLVLMPSQVPVVMPYSILPVMMPLVPLHSPAYPPGLPPLYTVLPIAVSTFFPGLVPVMQPVLPNIPVYPQPTSPRCLDPIDPIDPTSFVTLSEPFQTLLY